MRTAQQSFNVAQVDLIAQMKTFVRIVEGGSLASAAKSLNLSVAAVSRQLQSLEDELGAALILRSTRHHQITEAGQVWYQRTTIILQDIEAARLSVRPGAVQGHLSVSSPITIGMHCVVPALPPLLARFPKLNVQVSLDDRLIDLIESGVDVVVRAGGELPSSTGLVARPLMSFRRVVVASGEYWRKHPIPKLPAHLADHHCVVQLGGNGPLSNWEFTKGKMHRAIHVPSRLALTAPLAVRDMAVAGAGIAWLPEWLVREDLTSGRLVQALAEWSSAEMNVWALFRIELRGTERVRAFIEAVQRQLEPHRPPLPDAFQ